MADHETNKRPKLKDIDVHYKYDGTAKTHHVVGRAVNEVGRVLFDGDVKFSDAPESERDDDEPTPWLTIANSVTKAVAMCLYEIERDLKANTEPPDGDPDDVDDPLDPPLDLEPDTPK